MNMRRAGAVLLLVGLALLGCRVRSAATRRVRRDPGHSYLTDQHALNLGQRWGEIQPFTTMKANLSEVTSIKSSFFFRSFDPDGVVFYGDTKAGLDWFVLALRGGVPEMQIGKGDARVSVSGGPRLDDGLWHQVQVSSVGQFVVLEVDGAAVLNVGLYSPNMDPELQGQIRLALGGILVNSSLLFSPLRPEMDGCLQGGNWLNLSAAWESHLDAPPKLCFQHLSRGSYFPGTGLALLQSTDFPLDAADRRITVEVSVHTERHRGTLFAVLNRQNETLITATLQEDTEVLKLTVCGRDTFLPFPSLGEASLAVSVWEHGMQLQTGTSAPMLQPGDLADWLDTWESGVLLAVGGVPDSSCYNGSQDQDYFQGCLLKFSIQGKAVDLDRAWYKHDSVSSHSCPGKEPESELSNLVATGAM
ncbi:sex hormone-binding globulin [Amia ocellicauda]|uniref:sex hormone-binding globulin n=1 Tax=Amia ocellicauda TaxID=2972642 RepID=UPI00346486CA